MRLSTQRFLAILVALAFVVAGGRAAVLAQDDAADNAGPAGQPPLGSPVSFIGEEGNQIAIITITDYADPFEDYDPSSPPERGNRYIEVGLSVENSGRRPFPFSSFSIYLQDTEGFIYPQTFVFRPEDQVQEHPDYTGEDVPAGESLSGYLYFSVFNDAEIVRIVYTDGFQRLIFLADLTVEPVIPVDGGDDGADGGDDGTPADDGDDAAADDGAADDGAPADDGEDGGGTGQFSDEECEEITAWHEELQERLDSLPTDVLFAEDPDPDAIRDLADQLEDLAEEQADADVPEPAQAANDVGVASFEAYADAVRDYADAIEAGDDPAEAIATLFADIESIAEEFETLIGELEEACGIATE